MTQATGPKGLWATITRARTLGIALAAGEELMSGTLTNIWTHNWTLISLLLTITYMYMS